MTSHIASYGMTQEEHQNAGRWTVQNAKFSDIAIYLFVLLLRALGNRVGITTTLKFLVLIDKGVFITSTLNVLIRKVPIVTSTNCCSIVLCVTIMIMM